MSSGHPVSAPLTSSSSPSPRATPLIPERYLDIPSQRLYALSFALLIQVRVASLKPPADNLIHPPQPCNSKAVKIFDFLRYLLSPEGSSTPHYGKKWLLVDILFCLALSRLRIPRLNYPNSIVALQITCFALMNGLLFGGIRLHLFGDSKAHSSRDGALVIESILI